jgi:hypothetical protein
MCEAELLRQSHSIPAMGGVRIRFWVSGRQAGLATKCGLAALDVVSDRHMADRLTCSKCDIERVQQSRIAEWLEQALHCTLFEHSRAHSLISLSGDEDDWNLLSTKFQFLLKAGTGHSGHDNVEDQTSGFADAIGGEELFRRGERAGRKAELFQQVG